MSRIIPTVAALVLAGGAVVASATPASAGTCTTIAGIQRCGQVVVAANSGGAVIITCDFGDPSKKPQYVVQPGQSSTRYCKDADGFFNNYNNPNFGFLIWQQGANAVQPQINVWTKIPDTEVAQLRVIRK